MFSIKEIITTIQDVLCNSSLIIADGTRLAENEEYINLIANNVQEALLEKQYQQWLNENPDIFNNIKCQLRHVLAPMIGMPATEETKSIMRGKIVIELKALRASGILPEPFYDTATKFAIASVERSFNQS